MAAVKEGTAPFIHERALCETEHVGEQTRIWAFAHVLPGARIGRNCNICDYVFIENDVVVGDDVTVKCGVQLWDGVAIGNRVFIGPNATFTNDMRPRSKVYPSEFLRTIIEDDVSIGANSTILPGLRIGRGAMIGAGSVVTRDVPPHATLVGNPARIIGYGGEAGKAAARSTHIATNEPSESAVGKRIPLDIADAFLERLPDFADARGALTPLEAGKSMPFVPNRVFLVHRVPSSRVRGEHAHRRCKQFLVAVAGSLSVALDDGKKRVDVRLSNPYFGLYLPPMIWGVQYNFTADGILMVMASEAYDGTDYIRDYDDYRSAVGL